MRRVGEERLTGILRERLEHQPIEDPDERQEAMNSVRGRTRDLLNSWIRVLDDHHKDGVRLQYQRYEKPPARPVAPPLAGPRTRSAARAEVSSQPVPPGRGARGTRLREEPRGREAADVSPKSTGQIRRSQVISTYGPGALIDLPRDSAIVAGIDSWGASLEALNEPRVQQALARMTGVKSPELRGASDA